MVVAQVAGTIDAGPFPNDLHGSNFSYPWPVQVFKFKSQLQAVQMAFMDVRPSCESNGQTVLLLHGNNFCSATWEATIRVLSEVGYRVIAPDQVGYCKSSKVEAYQFSLNQLGLNTRSLLNAIGVGNVTVIGHSLGGMMAASFGLQYPSTVDGLVLVDPVGLENYVQKGVPYISIDESAASEAKSNYQSIKAYEQAIYYVGEWKASYGVWVSMLTNILHGPRRSTVIKNRAQIVDMVLNSPISQFFDQIQPRTLLMVGDKDKTAIGSTWASPAVAATLGHFNVLGPEIAHRIPNCTLHQFQSLGHAPQLSDPDGFHSVLLKWLSSA